MATKAKTINGTDTMDQIENAFTAGSETMKKSMEKAIKSFDELTTFNKSTVDAWVKSASVASKGFEAIGAEVASYTKQSVEESVAIAKAAMGSRSVQEFMEINTGFAKSAFDAYVGRVTKLGDLATATAKDAFEPLNGRMTALIEIVQAGRAQ